VLPSVLTLCLIACPFATGRTGSSETCTAGSVAGAIDSPKEIRSHHGVLRADLTFRNAADANGNMQYCYLDKSGNRSPTLRVNPGDWVILKLKNELTVGNNGDRRNPHPRSACDMLMTPDVTNLHFHGLSIPPSCHADDSLRTSIPAFGKPFVYRFRISPQQSPGLYWYHPHIHGRSEEQVLGGASGAFIVGGIVNKVPEVAGLPERIVVLRDHQLGRSAHRLPDRPLPSRDLSVNYVSVPYPDYPAPVIQSQPSVREFWRVLNASADTYVNLNLIFNGEWEKNRFVAAHPYWQELGIVALDGVPISQANPHGKTIDWRTDVLIPPGGRAEFILQAPAEGVKAELITSGAQITPPIDEDSSMNSPNNPAFPVDDDDATPPRPLAKIVASESAVEPPALPHTGRPITNDNQPALVDVVPGRSRKLYFSEEIKDPKHPAMSTSFFITEEGQVPRMFDPSNLTPNIVVHQGDVEDWTIENRSQESHVFHIHQLHFLLLERDGEPADNHYLLDTVDVPYWDGSSKQFPSVKLRMDFRNPSIVGIFPYHCHILQHADGGMMGLIEVRPTATARR